MSAGRKPIESNSDVEGPTVGHNHSVQFYYDDKFLAEQVACYVEQGLRVDEACIVFATPEHREAIERNLVELGVDVADLLEREMLQLLDAQSTLDECLLDGRPDPSLFFEKIGKLVARSAGGGRHVRVFGEMVALLWSAGSRTAAAEMESLWNDLQNDQEFDLYCAYRTDAFGQAEDTDRFLQLCEVHTNVLPSEICVGNEGQSSSPFRTIATLQQRVKALETEALLRTREEQEVRRSRDQMAAFIESSPIGLHWVSEAGMVLWANRVEMELLGYSPEEYIGHHISEFHADQTIIEDLLQRLSRDERVRNHQAILKCKDGTTKTVLIDSSVLREEGRFIHTQCFTRDISDERSIEATNRLLAAMVESCDDAVISKDLNGVITSWNSGAERVFGYTAAEAVGKPIMMLIPEDRHDEEPEVLRRIRSGQRIDHYETVRRRKDGELIDISLTVSPVFDATGKIIGASKIARDITAAKRDQRRLNELAEELAQSKAELEQRVEERTRSLREALEQMEEFSYTVSHDLRAPLRAMDLYANVLIETCGDSLDGVPDARRYLQRITDNCSRLDQMILDVLAFGRTAKGPLELRPLSLDKLVAQTIDNLPSLQPPSCEIEVSALGDVLAHEASLSQAISNLLNNAVKFVAPGVKPVIKVWAEHEGSLVRLWIEDNGIGIDPLVQHRLFGMFERLHSDLGYEGNGVGLAIVRKAIMRMRGRVGVESDGKSGSRFWIELPAAEGS